LLSKVCPDIAEGDIVHISALRIRNYRNFENISIDPFPRNAIILGENGTGKSNLLSAVQLVLDPNLPRSARHLRFEDICQATLLHTAASDVQIRIEIDLQGFDDNDSALSEFDGWIVSKDPLTARITYLWRRASISQDDAGVEADPKVSDFEWLIFGGSDESRDAARAARELPITVVPALRDAARDLEFWRTSPLAAIIDMRPPSQTVVDTALTSIGQATDQIAADLTLVSTGGRLRSRLSSMSGQHLAIDPTMGIAASRADQIIRSLRLYIDSARTRSISDTSTGGANVVYLALLLERLALKTEDDDQLDFVLGVEEPEAHLHPALQRQLFGFLLRDYSKLILTTHSPHIAAVADLNSIVLLRIESSNFTTVARTASGAGLTTQELADLDRYVDVSRAEFLFAKAVILVEGIADVYVLRALANRVGFDLDSWGVVIANVQGTDFGPYRALLGPQGFNVPHVIVTDGDQEVGDQWLGYKRAAKLVPGQQGEYLDQCVTYLRGGGTGLDLSSVYGAASGAGVFVGTHTLEVDLCPMFGQELATAVDALLSEGATTKPFERVTSVVNSNNAVTRKSLLDAVSNVSKGRLGQRLAHEIEAIDDSHPWMTPGAVSPDDPIRYLSDALSATSVAVGRGPLWKASGTT
jgi:putative ATP-dependent endonuclease of OLD family